MCTIAPTSASITAGGPQLSTDGVTPVPSILQDPSTSAVAGVSGGGANAAPDLTSTLQQLWGAIGSLQGALQSLQGTAGGGGAAPCGCMQATTGASTLAGGAQAAPALPAAPQAPATPAPAPAAPAAPVQDTAPAGYKIQAPLPGAHVTSPFGEISDIRSGRPHTGTDLSMGGAMHKPVLAAAPGKVVDVTFVVSGDTGGSGGGNMITVDHGNGWQTRYFHLSGTQGPSVKVGDVVQAGQELGKVGSTGNSTGAHLHFEVVKDGKSIDAEPYLNGQKTF